MASQFTKKTFDYFDLASKNRNNENWFLKNKEMYDEFVREPFGILIQQLDLRFGDKLPKIDVNPKKITRPLKAANKRAPGAGIIKTESYVTLWEKQTSMFEWNPGIHIQFGHEKDSNLIGTGLYMCSSRQLKLMRKNIDERFDEFHKIMNNKKFKKVFPELLGEKYVRFPKEYDANSKSAQYLWHKQFYVGNNFTRKEVMDKNFFKRASDEIELTLPFFKWIRETVGTYSAGRNTSISG
jgi:uncharacterized protein (TIGR02453 family)